MLQLLPPEYQNIGLGVVGRLDIDTEGLLLLTNNGELNHRLTSPRHHVDKLDLALLDGPAQPQDVEAFAAGLTLRDGTQCRSAVLEPLAPGESLITVCEGKYHQVRRMMASRGMHVLYLQRREEGGLTLGDLPLGACRELTQQELDALL